jgi:heme/copper-type cytochrome/quinol oxidase subunit 2
MPISIHAVSKQDFQAWLLSAKTKYASNAPGASPMQFAQAAPLGAASAPLPR